MGRKRPRVEHRTLTPQEARNLEHGGVTIAPGIWIDRQQGLHFSLPDILVHLGLPDTPEDRALATYGWANRKEGRVRIPIDRAMELQLERGFPTRKEPVQK